MSDLTFETSDKNENAAGGKVDPAGRQDSPDVFDVRPVPRISVQAFCESSEIAAEIEAVAADRRMSKAHMKVLMGGIAAAVEFYGSAPTPNLIILESGAERFELIQELERLAEVCDPGSKVIVIGRVNDVTLYRDLIHRGISEYLVAPIELFEIISTISNLYSDPAAEPLGRTVAFLGAKGGCGASTVAHNVAWSIARSFDSDVVLADFDLPFGTAGLDFNQDPLQGVFEALASPERLDETFLDRLLAKCTDRLSLLAAPASLERSYDYNEDAFDGLLDVMRKGAPFIVMDIPHIWTSWSRRVLAHADEIVLVAEPDLSNLRNAKNLMDTLRQLRPNDAKPHLILNRVNVPKRPEIKADEFIKALDLTALSTIPFEPQLFGVAANNGQMVGEVEPKNAVTSSFDKIAAAVSHRGESNKQKKSGLQPFMARLLKRSKS